MLPISLLHPLLKICSKWSFVHPLQPGPVQEQLLPMLVLCVLNPRKPPGLKMILLPLVTQRLGQPTVGTIRVFGRLIQLVMPAPVHWHSPSRTITLLVRAFQPAVPDGQLLAAPGLTPHATVSPVFKLPLELCHLPGSPAHLVLSAFLEFGCTLFLLPIHHLFLWRQGRRGYHHLSFRCWELTWLEGFAAGASASGGIGVLTRLGPTV